MREHSDDLHHRNSGAVDARLTVANLWIYGDSVMHTGNFARSRHWLKARYCSLEF